MREFGTTIFLVVPHNISSEIEDSLLRMPELMPMKREMRTTVRRLVSPSAAHRSWGRSFPPESRLYGEAERGIALGPHRRC